MFAFNVTISNFGTTKYVVFKEDIKIIRELASGIRMHEFQVELPPHWPFTNGGSWVKVNAGQVANGITITDIHFVGKNNKIIVEENQVEK